MKRSAADSWPISCRSAGVILVASLLAVAGCSGDSQAPANSPELPRGDTSPFEGYTLVAPLQSNTIYMVDMAGELVHQWETDYPGGSLYMLENGNLFRGTRESDPVGVFRGGGEGGILQEIAWDGTVVWEFKYSTKEYRHHHDIAPMPNGNVLLIAWEGKTADEAAAAGINLERLDNEELWPDFVVEIEPQRPDGGKVVWEWHAWDHLVQEHDESKANYGIVSAHPELIDINAAAAHRERAALATPETVERLKALGYVGGDIDQDNRPNISWDWLHTNSIDYNPEKDEILLNIRTFSEFWIIDHSTTTEEAAGHSGGRSEKGGDLLYRWGNPEAYGTATPADRQLFVQHDAHWIPPGRAGAGNIMVFNNGTGRAEDPYSSVDEIAPPIDADGDYIMHPDMAAGPLTPVWSYKDPEPTKMYSPLVSGSQRLPNGNTLICVGEGGQLREIGAGGAIVWEFKNPYVEEPAEGEPRRGGPGPGSVFRALRIPIDHPGLGPLID